MIPKLLQEISNPPKEIFILGELPPEDILKISIIGTRKATIEGKNIARQLSFELTNLGFIIVSGLAMGIDTAAHEGCLQANGITIAVLANGLNKIYPAQNENLARKILENKGAIISEYPPGTPAYKDNFLNRNRIISGLSIASIIIEAPFSSGALSTANYAAEQGREVFVIPGPINHPNYSGSHKLIRDGARIITSLEDILEDLGLENLKIKNQNKKQTQNIKKIQNQTQALIFKIIKESGKPLNIDRIIELTKLEPQAVNQEIALMIINEIIKENEKGYTI
ncbi:MAG: DNA-processing protein DprA [Candidatus Liptonbacteria bacterium]|nr:DNA-processing protein DprA [Candidatus Liptonbacteria bacterium]